MLEEIGQRLKSFAQVHYKTERALAVAIGVSDDQLSDLISGRCGFGEETLDQLAKTGINMYWLITGKEDMLAANVPLTPKAPVDSREDGENRGVKVKLVAIGDMTDIHRIVMLRLKERRDKEVIEEEDIEGE